MPFVTEECRLEHDKLAEAALEEVTGLMEYLQSPEALRNARRAKRTPNRVPSRTPNNELRTENRTRN